jgi:hypothetical protein
MSETVRYKGKLKLVVSGGTLQENVKKFLDLSSIDLKYEPDWEDEYEVKDAFLDTYYDQFYIINDSIYEVVEKELRDYEFNATVIKKKDVIEFDCTFYNGCTCLEEIIEEELSDE